MKRSHSQEQINPTKRNKNNNASAEIKAHYPHLPIDGDNLDKCLANKDSQAFKNLADFIANEDVETILDTIDFNATRTHYKLTSDSQEYYFSFLALICLNSIRSLENLALFEKILERIPLHHLDFNVSLDNEINALKNLICSSPIAELPVLPILKFFEKNPYPYLNFNLKFNNGQTPFSILTTYASQFPQLLIKVFENVPFENIDWTVKNPYNRLPNELPILWEIFWAATYSAGPEAIADTFIKNYANNLHNLDFTVRIPSGPTLEEWLLSTQLAPHMHKINLIIQINKTRELWKSLCAEVATNTESLEKMDLFQDHIKKLNDLVTLAAQQNPDAYYVLATFYHESGLVDQLKEVAFNLDKEGLYRDKIYCMLADELAYGDPTDLEAAEPSKLFKQAKHQKQERKKVLEEALDYAIEGKNSQLCRTIGINYCHSLEPNAGFQFPQEPLLDNLTGGKQTALYAMQTLRKKIKLEQKVAQKDAFIQEQDARIKELEAKLATFTR
ncbi:MAG TPA: hypothetical protein VFP93_01050 [Gammaproteobacteria bacterium]|nr:hypothetical protein [Gammaproteobacteria bacterium]